MDGAGAIAAQAPDRAGASRARARRRLSASAVIVILAAAGLAAALLCAVAGYSVARHSDFKHAELERAALSERMSELRVLTGETGAVDPHVVQALGRSAGLKDLKFETSAAEDGDELQPVVNGAGRIVGFLSWRPDTPMTDMIDRVLPLICGTAFMLVGFAGFSLWQLRRARSDLAASEAQARAAAEQDALTGLPNDTKMLSLLDQAMAERRGDEVLTYAVLGLDGMDSIVEQYGPHGGNEIVSVVAARLKDALPDGAMCGRTGANGFAILVCGEMDAAAMLRETIDAAARPHWIDTVVHISAHAGYAQAPADATTRDELLRRAELALRAAQDKGAGAVVAFERAIDKSASDQQFIRRELPRALNAGELDVHYQPIVAADGSRVTGVEALLRWTHKDRGAIPPMQFIPLAEEMGLMDALGAFVMRRALTEAKRWPELYLAVNLSPLQARDRRIVGVVRGILTETGSDPSRLMLEVTEGVLIDNPDEMVKRIEELHALGVRIALDDFGSGYSNLGYLQRFPFDKLKVDKSFVSALGRSHNSGVIIQAIVALGRALGVTVVVEGVETEEQRVLLRLAGCDEMQGYLFARPAPAKAIDELLRQRKSGKAKSGKPAAA